MYVYTIYNYNNLQRTLIVETTLQITRPLTTEVNPTIRVAKRILWGPPTVRGRHTKQIKGVKSF